MADNAILKENYKTTIASNRRKRRKMYAEGGEVWDEANRAAQAVQQNAPLEQYPDAPATTQAALNVAQGALDLPPEGFGPPNSGLIQRAGEVLGMAPPKSLEEAQAFARSVQEAHNQGLLTPDHLAAAQSTVNRFMDRKYAEGGAVEEAPPQDPSDMVNLMSPEGELGALPQHQLHEALAAGYRIPKPEEVDQHFKEEEFGTGVEQAKTLGEGVAQGVLGPAAPYLETHLGVSTPERIQARQETNPGTYYTGEGLGLAGSAMAGFGEGAVAEAVGKGLTAGLPAETNIARIGSAAARGAVENMLVQSGDEASKMLISDSPEAASNAAQTALLNTGLAGLIGGGFGGILGTAGPIWDKAAESKLGQFLHTVAEKAGGIEGQEGGDWLDQAVKASGVEVPPAVKAALGDNETLRHAFASLMEGGSTRSSEETRQALETFKQSAGQEIASAMGTSVDQIPAKTEISAYESGKELGNIAAEEYSAKVDPLTKQYETYSQRYKGAELAPSISDKIEGFNKESGKLAKQIEKTTREALAAQESGSVEKSIEIAAKLDDLRKQASSIREASNSPGTADRAVAQIMDKAHAEGWTLSPSSDIMREVNRVAKELPRIKTLEDLGNYIKQVGENTKSTLPFGQQTPVSRAGGIMKGILRKAEGDALGRFVGSEEGAEALAAYRGTQEAYAKVAALKDALDERLGIHGSVSGFGKALKNMSQSDGEAVLRKLSGKGDASILTLLDREFPRTADALRKIHVEHMLASAKTSEGFNPSAFFKNFNNPKQVSPELREFLTPHGAQGKLQAIEHLLNAVPARMGPSGTAKTLDSLWQHVPASASAMAAALDGHNPISGFLLGKVAKFLGRDVPDAAKLAMLKFVGSGAPVNSAGFRSAVDFANHVIQGESKLTKSVQNVFRSGSEVIPAASMPNERTRAKLDKTLQSYQGNPQKLLELDKGTGHYLPEHATAISGTATQAVGMLNNMRPSTQINRPLDSPKAPNPAKLAEYNKTLDIAQQPLIILHKMQQGTMTAKDAMNLKAMYPALYSRMAEKLSAQMMEQMTKGKPIPYGLRMQLSTFLGQPLDSTMTPQAILSTQMTFAPKGSSPTPAKGKLDKLGGVAKSAQTKGQFRESARAGSAKD